MDLVFSGEGLTPEAIEVFVETATRWGEVITADLTPVTPASTEGCANGVPDRGGTEIDDILIDVRIEPIDGPGQILGSAGPCIVRSSTDADALLPAYGTMRFDSADVDDLIAAGKFDETILHEMGHVLGFGTLWDNTELFDYESDPSTDPCRLAFAFIEPPVFIGANAVDAWRALGGIGDVPVEEEYGAGTQCGHWDEETFHDELMTGFLDETPSNPLSELTIASLADLGYGVDRSQAGSYALPACSPACLRADDAHGLDLAEREIVLYPIYEIGPDGEQRRLPGAPTR